MKKPIHITEMRKQLDIAAIRKQLVNLKCWKLKTGDIIAYKGWLEYLFTHLPSFRKWWTLARWYSSAD